MPTTTEGLIAIAADSGITPLGYLVWFSVPDEGVSLRRLKTALGTNGLPLSLAPKDTRAVDVFKRAMRAVEGRRRDSQAIIETDVRLVSEDPGFIYYHVSRVVKDLDERTVDYPKALRVSFNKSPDTEDPIHYQPLGGVPRAEIAPMMEAIEAYIEKNGSKVSGARVRSAVRNYIRNEPDEQRGLHGLSGENMRGKAGGIYFVQAKFEAEIQSLSAALTYLYNGRGYLNAVPLADSASERELVRRHHVANTRSEVEEALSEVNDLLRDDRERAVRSDVVANQFARFRALQRRSASYAKILADEATETDLVMSRLKSKLDKLQAI